jgi:CheY-like chemotaxis protein
VEKIVPVDQDPSRRRKVVVIDDDLFMRELVSLHLRNAGYEVFAAEDAVAGGHAILRETPDVIICDVEMPYLNGYEFVAALKTHAITKNIPVVFLTSREDVDEYAGKLGAAAYLRKPLTSERLLEVVDLYAA